MTKGKPGPPSEPAQVHAALMKVAREQQADFNAILVQYAIERLLHRLSLTKEVHNFILKGAMLFRVWEGNLHRPTRDVDFLGYGEPSPESIAEVIRAVITSEGEPDGLRFESESVKAQEIREGEGYGGVSLSLRAFLAHIPVTVRIDVGFGDAVTPDAETRAFPTLIGHTAPRIRVYSHETLVAEKVEALCRFGIANSRMKDYYDLLSVSRRFETDGPLLANAISATFERRKTEIPREVPVGLSSEFSLDQEKQQQWQGFLHRLELSDAPMELPSVVEQVSRFVLPVLVAAGKGEQFPQGWKPHTGWEGRASEE